MIPRMPDADRTSPRAARKRPRHPDETRMTLGEHLEELRGCVLRSLIALAVACIPCIWAARYLLSIIAGPLFLVNRLHGQPDSFLTTSPVEAFLVYVKVVLIAGVVLAGPYVLYELWSFVSSGLYPRERSAVYRLVPFSVGLFLLGVLFMYGLVLVLSLNFLVGVSSWLKVPEAEFNPLHRWLVGEPGHVQPVGGDGADPRSGTQPAGDLPQIPFVAADPPDPPPGSAWFNVQQQRWKLRGPGVTYSLPLARDDVRPMMTAHFRIGEYLTFVLILTLAFGAAFQTPLVVLFLVRSGLATVASLRSYRKVVIMVIVIIAGVIAPPDLFSHLALSIPMYLLFELGLRLASWQPARTAPTGPGAAR
jgi:Tat protein translocase TatC